jgi:hypothetical protein
MQHSVAPGPEGIYEALDGTEILQVEAGLANSGVRLRGEQQRPISNSQQAAPLLLLIPASPSVMKAPDYTN